MFSSMPKISPSGGDPMNVLRKILLTPTADGRASGPKITADTLWNDGPVAVFVARRPGCPVCRLDARKLSLMFRKHFSHVKLICIIKELAKEPVEDKQFGVSQLQTKYFDNFPIYVDTDRKFYEFFGNKSVLWQPYSYSPCGLYSDWKTLRRRIEEGGIDEYNLAYGESLIKGGFLLISEQEGVVYKHEEMTGSLLPLEEIETATRELMNKYRVQLGLTPIL